MELKCVMLNSVASIFLVLIIPYGIEMKKIYSEEEREKVLIIPYGIEISDIFNNWVNSEVLIIPYGIEMLR